ncbi:hypothetical protein RRG08_052958 [Elysia crispata]|uniref:Uncharacterized protein n=1 Tax=Elysia crispata TaxID=231223 RepID=A0AAE0ZJI2_9GAST|nr:hypothetical protein RRG08_052958 [Elysia crispata]
MVDCSIATDESVSVIVIRYVKMVDCSIATDESVSVLIEIRYVKMVDCNVSMTKEKTKLACLVDPVRTTLLHVYHLGKNRASVRIDQRLTDEPHNMTFANGPAVSILSRLCCGPVNRPTSSRCQKADRAVDIQFPISLPGIH